MTVSKSPRGVTRQRPQTLYGAAPPAEAAYPGPRNRPKPDRFGKPGLTERYAARRGKRPSPVLSSIRSVVGCGECR